jgi:fucose 4-O-acetylase-like acetyltransferase
MKERDASWDFVKTVLMFVVVFGHVCPAGSEWTPVTRIVGLFVMPLFFFVSGYFQSRITSFKALVGKLKKTTFRIVIPMMVWGGFYVFLSVLKIYQFPSFSSGVSVYEYVKNVVGFLKYTPLYIAGFYWFLTALLLCIVVGSCLSYLMTIRQSVGIFVLIISPLLFCMLPYTMIELYHFSFVWLFYVTGMLFREYEQHLICLGKPQIWNVFFFIALVVVIYIGSKFHPRDTFYYTRNVFSETSVTFIIIRYAIYLLAVVTMLYWIRSLYNRFSKNILIARFANYGQDTLFIYCSHVLFIDFLYKPLLLSMLYHVSAPLMIVFCEHLIGILLSIVLYSVLQLLCSNLIRFKSCRMLLMGL